ncbi:Kinesin-like protein KIN-14K [Vitis vinifera]|uniref:Kinesin-like protein n=1 Tax=Vitis vinifera TaxID=29760 RepID=A0A438JJU1_VITVI|nr:Kinesin-like protein KIN-14K [Vitis vinifera]
MKWKELGIEGKPLAASIHHVGHRFQEGFQLKQGGYADFPAAKISELVEQKSLENTPTHLLFSILINILDGSIERKNGDVPHRVAFLLRKIIQEIEQRISTQAENLKNQNNLYKAREEKYQSRIRVLETLATGTTEENRVVMHQLQQIKIENTKIEERKKLEEQDVDRLMKEKDRSDNEILALKEELEMARKTHEKHCLQLETQAKETKVELEKKLKELENLLTDSKKKVKELEAFSESKSRRWKRKELRYQNFVDSQFGALQELRVASDSIKREVLKTHRTYSEEFNYLGMKLKGLTEAAENYHMVLEENRRLYNEVQDLKGNIRVYCRIRPFLPGQSEKYTTIEYIGENGELVIVNPAKQGKDSRRLFKFNKVFSPAATQEEVFLDTQPLIRSVLDGYNVCIFAYGQTGSGKTYTMTGPDVSSKVDWGVNYRALNDLFHISQSRKSSIIILTVHVRGLDLETDAVLRGSLHLVDLAGSERVLRSEATGDRLREAQHINKSLSALGDVIFALAQKSPHVPYRNSKLTQVLQSSLGGQAKTLMFVQLNPDVDSYSETISTLKFAERVSGVELGAARSNKEGRDVRELMEQVAFLRDSNAKRIWRLNSCSRLPQGKGSGLVQKAASDLDNCSEYSDKHSEAGSLPSIDDFRHKECFAQSKLAGGDVGQNFTEDIELLGFGDADSEERLSDISDGGLSMGTETDGSISSIVEFTLFPEAVKPAENTEKIEKLTMPSKLPRIPQKQGPLRSSRLPSSSKSASKVASSSRKTPAVASSSSTKLTKRWHFHISHGNAYVEREDIQWTFHLSEQPGMDMEGAPMHANPI